MRRHWLRKLRVLAAVVPIGLVPLGLATAAATPGVLVYPGMAVHQDTNACTLGFVDPVSRVAFTAGHCRGSGVVSDAAGNPIGRQARFQDNTPDGATIDTNHVISDWETIQLDGDVAVNNILPGGRMLVEDPAVVAAPGLPVCHFGVVTGESCGNIEAVYNGWFTMAHGVVSQRGDSGGPVYLITPDGRAAIVGMFNSTWGDYPAAVAWQNVSGQSRNGLVQASGTASNGVVPQP